MIHRATSEDARGVVIPQDLAEVVLLALVPYVTTLARVNGAQPSARCLDLLKELHAVAEGSRGFSRETKSADVEMIEVSTIDMARSMGCSRQYVARLCARGVLPARRIGQQWLIMVERNRVL